MSGADREDQIPDNLKLATIALLTNVNCRARLETLESMNDIRRRQRQKMRRDVRFYRKRIMAAFKDLLLRRDSMASSERVQHAFDEFVRVIIEELRMSDTSDIIQSDLNDGSDQEQETEDGHQHHDRTGDIVKQEEGTDDQGGNANQAGQKMMDLARSTDKVITYANELLTATKTAPATMDKFVIRKSIDIPEIKSVQRRHEQIKNTPPVTKVDLKEPRLRTKGIPPKKENVNSSYDKTDGQAEPAKAKADKKKFKRRKGQDESKADTQDHKQ